MSELPKSVSDGDRAKKQMDFVIGSVLRYGVLIAGAIILIGGVLFLVQFGAGVPQYQHFRGEPVDLRTLGGIIKVLASFDPRGIIQLGFLLLILTPVARVAFSIFAFGIQRDWIYVAVTLFVLATLIFSLSGGHL